MRKILLTICLCWITLFLYNGVYAQPSLSSCDLEVVKQLQLPTNTNCVNTSFLVPTDKEYLVEIENTGSEDLTVSVEAKKTIKAGGHYIYASGWHYIPDYNVTTNTLLNATTLKPGQNLRKVWEVGRDFKTTITLASNKIVKKNRRWLWITWKESRRVPGAQGYIRISQKRTQMSYCLGNNEEKGI